MITDEQLRAQFWLEQGLTRDRNSYESWKGNLSAAGLDCDEIKAVFEGMGAIPGFVRLPWLQGSDIETRVDVSPLWLLWLERDCEDEEEDE